MGKQVERVERSLLFVFLSALSCICQILNEEALTKCTLRANNCAVSFFVSSLEGNQLLQEESASQERNSSNGKFSK